jgi:hypothetical protein
VECFSTRSRPFQDTEITDLVEGAAHDELRVRALHPEHVEKHVVVDVVAGVEGVGISVQHGCSNTEQLRQL